MTAYPCPSCRTTADLAFGCPGCGRPPDPDAAEVIRLGAEIVGLSEQVERARRAYAHAQGALREAQQRRDAAAGRVRAALLAAAPAAMPRQSPQPVRPEASTRTVQNVLFILGGVLLGTAAIVFTAVAWAAYGVGGRALILASVTGLALGAPLLALRRGLAATAETFAAVGLLLVLLDGYAAWTVNLFGVADGSATAYAGAVCAVTAVVAIGYGTATRLVGPRFAALPVAQPALPLLCAPLDPDATGWALILAAVATLDLAVVWWRGGGEGGVESALIASAWAAFGCVLATSGVCALVGLGVAGGPGSAAAAGAALVVAALHLVAAALVARLPLGHAVAGGGLVLALAVAGGRFVVVAWEPRAEVLVAGVAAGLGAAVAGAARVLPNRVWRGPWVAALTVVGTLGLLASVATVTVAVETVTQALPAFTADLSVRSVAYDWQLPAAVALLLAGLLPLLPRPARIDAAIVGGMALVLALPAATALPWWAIPALDVVAGAPFAVAAARARLPVGAAVRSAAAAVLAAHAVLTGLARPGAVAGVLAALVVLGVAVAALGLRSTATHARIVGGSALAVGLLAWPGAVAAGLAALRVEPWWLARSAVLAAAVLVGVHFGVNHRWQVIRWYACVPALAVSALSPLWAVLGQTREPSGVYAAVALVLIGAVAAAARLPVGATWGAAVVPALWLAVTTVPPLWAVLGRPYAWLVSIWSGRPDGVGVSPDGAVGVAAADAVALALLAVAVALPAVGRAGSFRGAGLRAAPVAVVTLPVALAAAGAPWPAVPAASLLAGLGATVAAALYAVRPRAAAASVPAGIVLTGAGLAGALPTEAATIGALGLTMTAAVVAGAGGRTGTARVAGWLAAVGGATLLAIAAGLAADLAVRAVAFAVLAVAAATLACGTALRGRRRVESVALQAVGHAGAVVALALTVGAIRYAAAVCTLWGVVLGMRALWPGERANRRRVLVAVAAGTEVFAWWLLMTAEQVALVEAYTLPAAAVALLAGWLAMRSRPALSSWVTYGPALAAAFLPSLASVLAEAHPVRRLLLGAGAIAAVLAGAAWRRQAPVVLGGAVVVAVALHELALVWDRLPRWIPLATGGLLLVGLAMTLERRRRDLDRVRRAVGRMT